MSRQPSAEDSAPKSSLARNAAISFFGGIFAPASSFLTAPILAHALSVEGRGHLAAATVPLFLVTYIATAGLPEAVTYFIARDKSRTVAVFRQGILFIILPAAIATATLVALSPWISTGDPVVRRLIVLSAALVLPSLLLSVVRAVAAAHDKWMAIAVERIIGSAAKLIPLLVLFVTGHLTLISAAVVIFASSLISFAAYVPLLALRNEVQSLVPVSTNRLLRYSSAVWIGSISGVILQRIDQVLLAPLAGAYQLGLYAVAVSISELPLVVNAAIRETSFTKLSGERPSAGQVGELSRISTIIVCAACIPVAALSPILIPILFGKEFAECIPTLLVLLLTVTLANPGSMAGVGLSSAGFPHLRSVALIVAAIVNIALIVLLAPLLGAVGAAFAALVGYFVASNIAIVFMVVKQDAKIRDFYGFRLSDVRTVLRLAASTLGQIKAVGKSEVG